MLLLDILLTSSIKKDINNNLVYKRAREMTHDQNGVSPISAIWLPVSQWPTNVLSHPEEQIHNRILTIIRINRQMKLTFTTWIIVLHIDDCSDEYIEWLLTIILHASGSIKHNDRTSFVCSSIISYKKGGPIFSNVVYWIERIQKPIIRKVNSIHLQNSHSKIFRFKAAIIFSSPILIFN